MPDIRSTGRNMGGRVGVDSAASASSATTQGSSSAAESSGPDAPLPSHARSMLLRGAVGPRRPAALVHFDRAKPDPERWREQLRGVIAGGDAASLPLSDVMALQVAALGVAQRLFTNEFNDDGDIKHHIARKQERFTTTVPDAVQDAVFRGNDHDRQCDALVFIIHSFRGADDDDAELRRSALQKLGKIGRPSDLDFVLPLCRKAPTSSDLHHAIECAKAIGRRHSIQRGGLTSDPVIAPLLQKAGLNDDERSAVLEAVLMRGQIESARRHNGGNMNIVYFVTFKERMKDRHGNDVTIRAVYKPETTWTGKDKCFYSREVAAYEFDRAFTKTGMIPPTAEALLDIDGDVGLGSLQYMIPNARPLGADLSGMSVDEARQHADDLRPELRDFVQSEHYMRQEAKLRTLLFVLGDPDKLANEVHPKANLQNIMVDATGKLWMIDNGYAMGAPPRDPGEDLLPQRADGAVLDTLHATDKGAVGSTLEPLIGPKANEVAGRIERAERHLAQKPRV